MGQSSCVDEPLDVDRLVSSHDYSPRPDSVCEAARLLGIARETPRYKRRDLRLFVTRSFDAAEDNPPRPVRLAHRAAAT